MRGEFLFAELWCCCKLIDSMIYSFFLISCFQHSHSHIQLGILSGKIIIEGTSCDSKYGKFQWSFILMAWWFWLVPSDGNVFWQIVRPSQKIVDAEIGNYWRKWRESWTFDWINKRRIEISYRETEKCPKGLFNNTTIVLYIMLFNLETVTDFLWYILCLLCLTLSRLCTVWRNEVNAAPVFWPMPCQLLRTQAVTYITPAVRVYYIAHKTCQFHSMHDGLYFDTQSLIYMYWSTIRLNPIYY